ncbi:MAG: hypothetical protein GY810_17870 [Aureispira sp.]|nr:hypothetical protein [Aureispira sp.]
MGILSLTLPSCTDEVVVDPPVEKEDSVVVKAPIIVKTKGQPISLIVSTQQAIIRQEPSLTAKEIKRCTKGDSLFYMNEATDATTQIKLEGIEYDEPWLKVIWATDQTGWVYGGCIRFEGLSHQALNQLVLQRRIRKFFGGTLFNKLLVYQKEMQDLQTLPAFKMMNDRSEELQDSLTQKMNHLLAISETDTIPDFFWLNDAFPGFLVHYLDGEGYQLYKDYKQWYKFAQQTPAPADDAFVEVYFMVYNTDSIEYTVQDWQWPTPEGDLCSVIGKGVHLEILGKINKVMEQSPYFEQELIKIKQALVNDIAESYCYWSSLKEINTEIDAILAKNYGFVNSSDLVALKTRKKLLKAHKANDIRVNIFEQ